MAGLVPETSSASDDVMFPSLSGSRWQSGMGLPLSLSPPLLLFSFLLIMFEKYLFSDPPVTV